MARSSGKPEGATRASLRLASSELRESEERFRLLVESVQDYAIFMLDPDGYVASWNIGAERIKGYTANEIIGKHFSNFYPEEDQYKPPLELEIARREGRVEDEGWRLRRDGTRFWANVVITALFDETGELRGFAKVTRDLTERRAAEQARARFIANAAHELRTPVTTIIGFSDALARRDKLTDEQIDQAIAALHRGSERLITLVENLLDISRIEDRRLRLECVGVDVGDVIRQSIEVAPAPPGKTIVLEKSPTADVLADAARLRQVIVNLLVNAYRYGGDTITISWKPLRNHIRIVVQDNGPGIDPAIADHAFDAFTRGSNVRGFGGSGLGLAISRMLVEAMNGSLNYVSSNDGGARFLIELEKAP